MSTIERESYIYLVNESSKEIHRGITANGVRLWGDCTRAIKRPLEIEEAEAETLILKKYSTCGHCWPDGSTVQITDGE